MNKQTKAKIINLIGLLALFIFSVYVFQTFTIWSSKEKTTPIGEDFSIFWTASALSVAGKPEAAYDLSKLHAAQEALIGGKTPPGCGWYYPPIFLLMVLPLSLLPYLISLGLWLTVTILGYLLVVYCIAPRPITLCLTLAFPATFWNLFYAQNGFFSAALLGGGLLLSNRSPVFAGLLLGLMCYKPQFAILIPIALLAGRCWRALIATMTSILALSFISTLVLGYEVWRAFWGSIILHKGLFESGNLIIYQFVPTFFSAAILAGCKPSTAYLIQGVVMMGVILTIFLVWFIEGPSPVSYSVLVLGILLFSHFYCLYDLTLLALPLAWLGWEGYTKGWLRGERIILVIGWFMPIFRFFLVEKSLQISPLILLVLIVFAVRRHYRNCGFHPPNALLLRHKEV